MNIKKIIICALIVVLLALLYANMTYYKCYEGFKGKGKRGKGKGSGMRGGKGMRLGSGTRGGKGGGKMSTYDPAFAHRYWHRRRQWAGPDRGYSYGPRRHYFYDNWWPTISVPTATIATVPLTYGCKSGCVNLGNGEWGCQFPGDGITQCQFSADCEACDDRWWRPSTWLY